MQYLKIINRCIGVENKVEGSKREGGELGNGLLENTNGSSFKRRHPYGWKSRAFLIYFGVDIKCG
jgi:hypothetical protein